MTATEFDNFTELLNEKDERLQEPPLYRVIIHNDHYTTMEFVVEILEDVFHFNPVQAEQIMLTVHRQGAGFCGEYERQIAESKVAEVSQRAAAAGHPLRCTMERA